MVQLLYGLIVQWLYGYMVIVDYSNQVEWIIPKRFIPIWLMDIGVILLLLVETATWSKYNNIDNLSLTLVEEEKDESKEIVESTSIKWCW